MDAPQGERQHSDYKFGAKIPGKFYDRYSYFMSVIKDDAICQYWMMEMHQGLRHM